MTTPPMTDERLAYLRKHVCAAAFDLGPAMDDLIAEVDRLREANARLASEVRWWSQFKRDVRAGENAEVDRLRAHNARLIEAGEAMMPHVFDGLLVPIKLGDAWRAAVKAATAD